jgi:hypothetical protein
MLSKDKRVYVQNIMVIMSSGQCEIFLFAQDKCVHTIFSDNSWRLFRYSNWKVPPHWFDHLDHGVIDYFFTVLCYCYIYGRLDC